MPSLGTSCILISIAIVFFHASLLQQICFLTHLIIFLSDSSISQILTAMCIVLTNVGMPRKDIMYDATVVPINMMPINWKCSINIA